MIGDEAVNQEEYNITLDADYIAQTAVAEAQLEEIMNGWNTS